MLIYKVMARTNPTDWAEMAKSVELAIVNSRSAGEIWINNFKSNNKHWRMDYQKFWLDSVKVE
jgi:hypothetical protein